MLHTARLSNALRMAAACLAVLFLACAAARAQDDEKPPEPRPADVPNLPDVLKEGTLELKARLYLPDGKGEPRFVPNLRLGDLLDMVRAEASRSEGADLPTYTFDELTLEARVGADAANVTARARVTLNENALPVTSIGLRLQSCQLSQPISFEGEGKSQWQVGRSEPGYTWWLRAEPNTTHTATLVGQSVLVSEGDRQSLPLSLPPAPTTVELVLPANCQDVRARGPGGELLRSEPNDDDNEHKVVVRCNGGDINLSWRNGTAGTPTAGAAVATSETRLKIDDPREVWEAETEFTLRAFGEAPVETLTVELPLGAQWLPSPATVTEQFTIREITSTTNETSEQNRSDKGSEAPRTLESASGASQKWNQQRVRLSIQAQSGTGLSVLKSIPIRWQWTPPKRDESALSNVSIPSINVREVDRHDGIIALTLPASYGLEWKSQSGTELVQQLRVEDVPVQLQYMFRFARQPLGLVVSFRREVALAEVGQTYLAEVDRGKVKLTAWLECSFDRSRRPELGLEMGDWALHSAEVISDMSDPDAEGDQLSQEAAGSFVRLSNELDVDTAGSGRRQSQVWRIVAYRKLNEGSIEHLKLAVPGIVLLAPDGSRVPIEHATGVLLMAASDNVLISWDERNSQSLFADAFSSEWTNLLPEQSPERALAYRFQAGDEKPPVWSGRVEVLPRRIAAEQVANVRIDLDAVRISQKFALQIANEPLTQLQLISHGPLDGSVLVNGVPSVIATVESGAETDVPVNHTLLSVATAEKLFGKVNVEVRSQQMLPAPTTDSSETLLQLSLVQLGLPKAQLAYSAQLSITADRSMQVAIGKRQTDRQSNGEQAESAATVWSPLPSTPLELSANDEPLELRIRRLDEVDPLPVRVSGAWMQTAVNGSTRLDRFCARFQTEQEQLVVMLPTSDLFSVQIAVDGVLLNRDVDTSRGRLLLDLRDLDLSSEHTLEVWTRSAATLGWLNPIDVTPATIEGCPQFEHFYWQLVTPATHHLVLIPDSMTPEWRWVWDRLWWHRLSPQDQPFFEQWLEASSQPALAESANRYVVSNYGSTSSFRCWTASRLLLWLPIGLLAIASALAISVWPLLRHPVAVISLAVLMSLVAAAWPDLAILLGQTTLLAMLIVLLYALTQAAIESRVRRRSIFTTRPTSAMLEIGEHHSLVRSGSHASSEIMPTTRTQSPIVADGGGQ